MTTINLYQLGSGIIVLVLFLALLAVYTGGYALRCRHDRLRGPEAVAGIGTIEGALLGLLALFLGFTFSMSASRFDSRREAIINEANAISTAIRSADLYPDSIRSELRLHFKTYLEARIAYAESGINQKIIFRTQQESNAAGDRIWKIVSGLSHRPEFVDISLVSAPSVTAMLDAATSRDAARISTVPEVVIWVLLLLSICSGFIIGYGGEKRKKNHLMSLVLLVMITLSVYLIIDLDRPRRGLITTDSANAKITELRTMLE